MIQYGRMRFVEQKNRQRHYPVFIMTVIVYLDNCESSRGAGSFAAASRILLVHLCYFCSSYL